MGSPFPVGPAFANGVDLYAVILVATCKFCNASGIVRNGAICSLEAGIASLDYLRVRLQPKFLFEKGK